MASGEARLGSAVYNARDDAHRAEHWPGCEIATRPGAREGDRVDGVLVGDGTTMTRAKQQGGQARTSGRGLRGRPGAARDLRRTPGWRRRVGGSAHYSRDTSGRRACLRLAAASRLTRERQCRRAGHTYTRINADGPGQPPQAFGVSAEAAPARGARPPPTEQPQAQSNHKQPWRTAANR